MIVRKSRSELESMREGCRMTAACFKMLRQKVYAWDACKERDVIDEEVI